MGAMRFGLTLRLTLEFVRRHLGSFRALDGSVELGAGEFGAVVELLAIGWIARIATLVPDRQKPCIAVGVEKVRVREVKSLDVNDADDDSFAAFVAGRGLGLDSRRGGRSNGRARNDWLGCLEGFAKFDETHPRVLRQARKIGDGDARFGDPAAAGGFFDDLARQRIRSCRVNEYVGHHLTREHLQMSPFWRFSFESLTEFSLGERVLAPHQRNLLQKLIIRDLDSCAQLSAYRVHGRIAVGDHAQLRLYGSQVWTEQRRLRLP